MMLWIPVCLAFCLNHAETVLAATIEIDYVMYSDPQLDYPEPVEDFDPAMAALWLQALNRPEADLQRMAAETIARAHEYGVPELDQSVPRLEELLLAGGSHPTVRFAAARALIVLGSQDSADKLFEASQTYGADLRQLVEPALAVWNNASARAMWITRLDNEQTRPRELIMAMRGLSEVGELSVLPKLLSEVTDPGNNPGIRLEAATAAGRITETGLGEEAKRLADDVGGPFVVNQLCAIRLVSRHSGDSVQQLLSDLARHEEPTVAAGALERLNQIDHRLVIPLAESAIRNSDPLVREQGVICLLQTADASRISLLGQLLADPHPDLRHTVCEGLYDLAGDSDLTEAVLSSAMQVLNGEAWQGQQEAALLLGALEHQPAADRFLQLLQAPQSEVRLPTAWALRKVAVPETIPVLLQRTQQLTDLRREQGDSSVIDQEVAHLFEALGVLRAEEAIPQMREYIPKRGDRELSRSAALWAIGRIFDGMPNPEMQSALIGRILDFSPQPNESNVVKRMAAVSLGRIKATDEVPTMKQFLQGFSAGNETNVRLALGIGWAIQQLTGETVPPPAALTVDQGRWFLEPAR